MKKKAAKEAENEEEELKVPFKRRRARCCWCPFVFFLMNVYCVIYFSFVGRWMVMVVIGIKNE